GRDELPIEDKVKLDEEYIKIKSFFIDIKIIFMTIASVAKSDGVVEGGNKEDKVKK
ncbi:MAG: sugar transferase, partial [Sarcina sp.]